MVALVIPVLPAAGPLLQAGAGLSTVTGPLLYLADADSHRRQAGLGTAAPKAPVAHGAVLSWMLTPTVIIITGYPPQQQTIKLQ